MLDVLLFLKASMPLSVVSILEMRTYSTFQLFLKDRDYNRAFSHASSSENPIHNDCKIFHPLNALDNFTP